MSICKATTTTSQALFHVFIRPTLIPSTCLIQNTHQTRRCQPQNTTITSPPRRNLNKYARAAPVKKVSLEDVFVFNEKIGSLNAHVVTAEGKLGEMTPLSKLLANIDRGTTVLRKVAMTPEDVPIVKEVLKVDLFAQLEARKKGQLAKTEDDLTKQVELTWAITGNDLKYRLEWIEGFLREGRRVEVVIAPKRGGRKATRDEISILLAQVRETVKALEGTEEFKAMDGVPGGTATMYFQNKQQKDVYTEEKKAKTAEGKVEKLERKNREKEENKEKAERRLKRKQEADKELELDKLRREPDKDKLQRERDKVMVTGKKKGK